MSNSYYNHTTYPSPNSPGSSAALRAELEAITDGFDLLPTLTGNGYKVAMVNAAGTALIASSALQALAITASTIDSTPIGATTRAAGNFTTLSANGAASLGTSVTIGGGAIDNTTIGATTPSTGAFTTLSASSATVGGANVVTVSATQTLTNKTLTAPVIATIVNTGTLTLPTATDTLVGRATNDTLTNKTISGVNNTLSNIGNSSLTNSSITIGSTSVSLGGTAATIAGLTLTTPVLSATASGSASGRLGYSAGELTFGNGSAQKTVATLDDTQTLTNKTISGSSNTLSNIGNSSLTNSSLTIGSTNISLGGTATTLAGLSSVTSTNFVGALTGNADTVTNGVYTSGSYSNPSWITALAGSKISGNISGNAGNVTGTVAVANGGTGSTTAAAARAALLPTFAGNAGKIAAVNASATDIEYITVAGTGTVTSIDASGGTTGLTFSGGPVTTSGTLTLGGTLGIGYGGTGATTAAAARTALGLAIGTNVQAWDADLDAIAGVAGSSGILTKIGVNTWSLDTTSYLSLAGGTMSGAISFASGQTFPGTQATLVSGTNIKTINGSSVLGSGNLTIQGGINYTRYTSNVTVADKAGVIADTTAGSFTVTLPANPSSGAQVAIADGASFATNNLTVGRNGSTIEGAAADLVLSTSGVAVTLIYDGTTWNIYAQVGGAGGSLVTLTDTQTLTNKTISADSNTLSGIAASSFVLSDSSGNIDGSAAQKAIPTGVVVGTTDTQTLTNKTISADSNTLSGIAASSFVLSDASGNIDGAAAQKAIPAGDVIGTTDAQTLTNKRIDPRVSSATSASSLTPTIASFDQYAYTALAANLTINAPTGTPVDGNKLVFRILDNGTSRTLTWNATYTAIGVTLPTATTAGKMTYVGCIYNAANTRWDVIAVTTQA